MPIGVGCYNACLSVFTQSRYGIHVQQIADDDLFHRDGEIYA